MGHPLAVDVLSLSHLYGERKALDDVSFQVEPKEIFGLIGPNGGGKSTTFRILATLMRPTSGTARLFGSDILKEPQAVRRHLGSLMQEPTLASDLLELTKPGICFLAIVMSAFGFFLGTRGPIQLVPFVAMLAGLACLGAASGMLNQYIERDIDAKMWRTLNRPLPSGRIAPRFALVMGSVLAFIGVSILALWVNLLTAGLGALTVFTYLAVYTPSKRVTSLSTLLGAIPGALPPLMGWTAAYGAVTGEGLVLFGILFFWQIPHFLAIAWMYRDDYARAGLPILSVLDTDGYVTAKQVLLYTVSLLPITLIPFVWGMTGTLYFWGAALLGLCFLGFGVFLAVHRSVDYARRLFFASLLYLPALGFLMVWDRAF